MTARCQARERLDAWERCGEGAPLDRELEEHLESCDECAAEHDEIVDVRRRLRALPVRRIASHRLDAMRFELLAAARASAREAPPAGEEAPERTPEKPPPLRSGEKTSRLGRRWAVLLVAAVGLSVALFFGLRARPGADDPRPVVEVELAEGASGLRAQDGADEVYALLRGKARFHVQPLRGTQRFRVRTGGDTVEVRGTRFTVEAADGQVAAVDVEEGKVVLTLAEGESHVLVAGESWRRQALALGSSDAPPPPVAEPVEANAADGVAPDRARGRTGSSPVSPHHDGAQVPAAIAAPGATPSAAAIPSASAAGDPRSAFDAEFQRALGLMRSGHPAEAAAAFDALRNDPAADQGRRADALYWAARSRAQAGDTRGAEEGARKVLETQPDSWHADDAALLLGEALLRRGDTAGARPWLERAARSPREAVRTRALKALGKN